MQMPVLNILIYGIPFYVIINMSYKLLNVIRFFGTPCVCHDENTKQVLA